jgi:hypothetical protein
MMVLGLSGSLRTGSYNGRLLDVAAGVPSSLVDMSASGSRTSPGSVSTDIGNRATG